MKSLKLSQTVRLGLIATAMSTLPMILPVSAQTAPGTSDSTTPGTTTGATTDPTTTTTDTYHNDAGFDWGWLGLLGLIGLAGLRRKPEDTNRRDYVDAATASRTDYRS